MKKVDWRLPAVRTLLGRIGGRLNLTTNSWALNSVKSFDCTSPISAALAEHRPVGDRQREQTGLFLLEETPLSVLLRRLVVTETGRFENLADLTWPASCSGIG
jgi:hypothetical protein